LEKKTKKRVKKKRNALLITVVIHNAFESGEIWILNQLNIKKKIRQR
jgi:hypothetical protein